MRSHIIQSSQNPHPRFPILRYLAFWGLLSGTFALIWATSRYEVTIEELIFYLTGPLQGTSRSFLKELFLSVFLPATLCVIPFALLHLFLDNHLHALQTKITNRVPFNLCFKKSTIRIFFTIWLAFLLIRTDTFLNIHNSISGIFSTSRFIEDEYIDARNISITFPQKKRNLITLYIESAESTNQDIAHGGYFESNLTPELTILAEENVSFSQTNLISGASVTPYSTWTTAGMVAQTAGIPLKIVGNLSLKNMHLVSFLPGVYALGDLLESEGYTNVVMAGSDFQFGERRDYYQEHGHYQILDYYSFTDEGIIPYGYWYGWGVEDQKLYLYAKKILTELGESGKPFHFAFLTQDTHDPGFPCDLCPESDEPTLSRTIRCSSKQAYNFIKWCQEQPWYENTVIVITGDHTNMNKEFYRFISPDDTGSDQYNPKRGVYNCFINSVVQPTSEKNRKFTTLDFYPTVLASMGVTIEGDRLGLGTNLFSDKKTLSEIYGYDTLFTELQKRSPFYNKHLLRISD